MSGTSSPPAGPVPARISEPVDVRPAASVWGGPNPVERDEQVACFQREGFVVLEGALGPAELEELDREIRRLSRDHASLPRIRAGFELESVQDAERGLPVFRRIGGVTELSEAFGRLLVHPRVLDLLHDLIGPRIELWRDLLMMKPARVGREKPWHQDSAYWPWRPMRLVTVMTAIDAATPRNGCLQVLPGSHGAALPHHGREKRIDPTQELQARTLHIPLAAGDMLVFHSLLLHASEPNRSGQDRRACFNTYKSPDLVFVGRPDQRRACSLVSVREA
ncbi:MAG TPA: phytanoyl-CoA dioxygenase family protein [Myxococcota bacterium]